MICCLNSKLHRAAVLQVNPHRIKEMDVQFMARLSQAAPVIPILAKVHRVLPLMYLICASDAHTKCWSRHMTAGMRTSLC
jgi:hypothetical protein